jgi:hypothetical protein
LQRGVFLKGRLLPIAGFHPHQTAIKSSLRTLPSCDFGGFLVAIDTAELASTWESIQDAALDTAISRWRIPTRDQGNPKSLNRQPTTVLTLNPISPHRY